MNTKVCVFSMLTVAVMATSCSNEIVETANDQAKEISFQTVLGKQTKASETTTTTLVTNATTSPIAVAAYASGNTSTTPIIPSSTTLTYDATHWKFNPAINQPGYSLIYYAWHPKTTVNTLNAGSNGISGSFDYTIPSVDLQEDLIADATTSLNAIVNLNFNHLLSQVNFAVKGVQDLTIRARNITVNDVVQTATYAFNATDATKGAWGTPSSAYADYLYNSGTAVATDKTTTDVYIGNGNGTYSNTNALMLMPQTFTNTGVSNFSFEFQLENKVGDVVVAWKLTSVNFWEFGVNTWEMGKRYVYMIDFTNYLIGGEIKFLVDVVGWENSVPIIQTIEVAVASKESIEAAITTHLAANTSTANEVFPIRVAVEPTAAIALDLVTKGIGFTAGDKIVIELPSITNIANITASDSETTWTRTTSGSVVTFTKK